MKKQVERTIVRKQEKHHYSWEWSRCWEAARERNPRNVLP